MAPRASALLLSLLVALSCGTGSGNALSGSPERTSSSPGARPTLPPDDPSLQACVADWIEGFLSLPPLVDRADLIVRASVRSTATSSERWGVGYRTTLRVTQVLKPKGASLSELTLIESACPVVYQRSTDDWILFVSPKADEPGVYQAAGGIQGAFPLQGGKVRPAYRDAWLVRMYASRDAADLIRDIAAVDPIDADATVRLRREGWTVAGKGYVRSYALPSAGEFGETRLPPRFERPFQGYAEIAAKTGLDLRPYGGREIEELAFFLERVPPPAGRSYPPIAHLVYADRRFVGGWVQISAAQLFRLDERAAALAATPANPAPTQTPNRYPNGVNVVREYGLDRATSAYVKPLVPSSTKGLAAPPVADLVEMLDRTLPTEAPPARGDRFWVVGFVLADAYVAFEYHGDEGILVQRDDGYAIRPPAGFGKLVGADAP